MRRYACLPDAPITDGAFSLATVQDAHIERIREWRNVQMDVLRQSKPISREQQERYYEERIWPTLESPQPDNILLIFREGDRPVGYCGLVHVAWEHRRAEVSFLLDPDLAKDAAGYARYFSACLGLLRRLAFDALGFHRLHAETYAVRVEHIRVLESCGFRLEGRLRDHVWIDGTTVDSLIHGCLNVER